MANFEEIQRTLNCKSYLSDQRIRTTQFSKRIKMESQVQFDHENFFRIKILNVSEETLNFNMRVWSWLRMNAGGVPNTCKSNGTIWRWFRSDPYSLVADGWVTRGQPAFHRGDSSWKRLVIPHTLNTPHGVLRKDLSVKDGSASD